MPFDVSKAMKDEQPDKGRSAADLARAFEPLRQQLRDAARNISASTVKRLAEEDRRRQQELVRGLSGMGQVERVGREAARSMVAAYEAQISGIARQVALIEARRRVRPNEGQER